jgi:hypothetical protein
MDANLEREARFFQKIADAVYIEGVGVAGSHGNRELEP